MQPLTDPHHDGSPLSVLAEHGAASDLRIGDEVDVVVEVPRGGADAVHLRQVVDGEPTFAELRRDRTQGAVERWVGTVRVTNPISRYRFLIEGRGGGRWLTQRGCVALDLPDTWDFALVADDHPSPSWVPDAVLYQVFPDRFARGGASDRWPAWAQPAGWDDPVATADGARMHQLYGGDLAGVVARLDHLEELGVTGLYLTPFFPAQENHRYCATSFDEVDPFLGGDEWLARLTAAAHERGMRVLGDLTLNHSGSEHPWFSAARSDADAPERGFYRFERWPDRYESWAGVPTLPKFDHADTELRRRLYDGPGSVVARYLAEPFELDGWRIDAANMAGRSGAEDHGPAIRRALHAVAAAAGGRYLLAEHCHDATADLLVEGWHGTMEYTGFTRAAWSWLKDPDGRADLLGLPVGLTGRPGPAVIEGLTLVRGQMPWRRQLDSMLTLGTHDTSRWASVTGDRARAHVGLAWLAVMPGVPSLLYGDEIGLLGADNEQARAPMPWDRPEAWDRATYDHVRELIRLRRGSVALRRGGLRWLVVGDDQLVLLREHPDERILVQLTRAADGPSWLSAELLGASEGERLLGDAELRREGGRIVVPAAAGPVARMWRLPGHPDRPTT